MAIDYLQKIRASRVYDLISETPLDPAPRLSQRLGNQVLLKREDLQPIFSFKIRGAYNKVAELDKEERNRGVIAASAGNHAQGVAMSAQSLSCPATIVMPITTPTIKIEAVHDMGANVILHGDSYDEAAIRAQAICEEEELTYIHPYDDPAVIAGQGTIAMEILRQAHPPPDFIFVPVGGGGLIAGIAAYLKQIQPAIQIIGVEPDDANAMSQSIQAGRRVRLDNVGLFVDGVAVRQVGEETFRITQEAVDDIVCVDTDAICAAIRDVFEDTRTLLEPAGALSIAGMKTFVTRKSLRGGILIAVASGANVNFNRLRHISERAELGEDTEAIIAATIPERPGSFKRFCSLLGDINITEFNYRYFHEREAHVFVGLEIEGHGELEALTQRLKTNNITTRNFSHNEVAKIHIRHLVGGRAPQVANERLLRFEFPERPGALRRFLDGLQTGWNITLFHYRNHGAAYGRVLAGIQVLNEDCASFYQSLDRVGYTYVDETDNPAYCLFLR